MDKTVIFFIGIFIMILTWIFAHEIGIASLGLFLFGIVIALGQLL